jgi:hypothetical protein
LLSFSAMIVTPFVLICCEPFDPDSCPEFISAPADPESPDPCELETRTSSFARPPGTS